MTSFHRVCFLVAALIGISVASLAQGTRLSQLERIDTVLNDANNQRYMPITLFASEIDHKGQTFTVSGTQSYRSIDSIARHLPLMDFQGNWISRCYEQFDVVVDGCWTMVADTFTCDRPSPQASGQPYWASGFGDNPPWISQDVSATQVLTGQRYTWGDSSGYLTNGRVWIPTVAAGVTYQLMVIFDPQGADPVVDLGPQIAPVSTGWQNVFIETRLILPGAEFDAILITTNTSTSSAFTWNWNYLTPNPQGSTPSTGQIVHPNQNQNAFRVHKTDNGGTDRSADLATVKSGDLISGVGVIWTVGTITDQGAYIEFFVTPEAQGSPTGVSPFEFTIYGAASIDYVEVTNHYLPEPQAQGIFSTTGLSGIVLDQNAYGIDIEIQSATISDEWSFLAYSCSGVITGGSGGAGDGNGMFDPANESGLWAVKNWNMTGGNSSSVQTAGEEWKIGTSTTERYFSIAPLSFGMSVNIVDESGSAFSIIKSSITNTLLATDDAFEMQVNGVGAFDILQTLLWSRINHRFDAAIIDVNSSAGTAGQVLSSTGTTVDWIDAATGGSSLWETDANGIVPIAPVDNIGIGVPSDAAYSLDAGLKMRVRYAIPANDEMLTLAALNTNDAFALYSIGADHFSAGGDNSINRFVISSGQNLNSPSLQLDATGVMYLPFYTTGGIVTGTEAGLLSHSPSGVVHSVDLGTDGQVLTMSGVNGFQWTTPGGGGGSGGIFDVANDNQTADINQFTMKSGGMTVFANAFDEVWEFGGGGAAVRVKFSNSIEDNASSTGTSGQVLTAGTGAGVLWAAPPLALSAGSGNIDEQDTLTIYITDGVTTVDSVKIDLASIQSRDSSIVMYQGEESGTINGSIDYPFSIGNGDKHDGNDNYFGWGWHMHSDGRMKRISVGGTGVCNGGAVMEIYNNGVATGQLIAVNAGNRYAKAVIDLPVVEDDVVNLKVTTGCSSGATDWVAYLSVKVAVDDY